MKTFASLCVSLVGAAIFSAVLFGQRTTDPLHA